MHSSVMLCLLYHWLHNHGYAEGGHREVETPTIAPTRRLCRMGFKQRGVRLLKPRFWTWCLHVYTRQGVRKLLRAGASDAPEKFELFL